MSDESPMFRSEAIDSMASPTRLSVLAPVTSARLWLLIAGGLALVAASVLWGLLGRVPLTTTGSGIIIYGTNVAMAQSTGTGRLLRLEVANGALVKAGDVIALTSAPVLQAQADGASEVLGGLQRLDAEMRSREDQALKLQLESLAVHETRLNAQIESAERLQAAQRKQIELCERLVKDGSVSQSDLLSLAADALDSERLLTDARAALARASQERVEAQNRQAEVRGRRTQEVMTAHVEATAAELRARHESRITAPRDGRVVQLFVKPGESLSPGQAVAVIATGDSAVPRCFAFFPISKGKHLSKGMRAMLSPSIAPRERWGQVVALVDSVEPFASTPSSMAGATQNSELVEDLEDRYGAMIGAELSLTLQTGNPSGLEWTSNAGYPHPIPEGTVCDVEVVVEEVRPAALLLPWLRGVGSQ